MSKIAGELNAEMSKAITSEDYQSWLNSPLTKALKRSFEQAIIDPENQPSQYGTVTLAMYEHLEEQLADSRQRVSELEKERDELLAALEYCRAVFDEYIGIHLDKTPPDYDKAARNENHRAACDAAIASVKGSAA